MLSMNRKFSYTNKCIPSHAEYLSWCETDGLMSLSTLWKVSNKFKEDPQGNFQSTKVVNFAMIHAQARGEKIDDKPYKTVCEKDLSSYNNKDDIVSSAIRVNRKDIYT